MPSWIVNKMSESGFKELFKQILTIARVLDEVILLLREENCFQEREKKNHSHIVFHQISRGGKTSWTSCKFKWQSLKELWRLSKRMPLNFTWITISIKDTACFHALWNLESKSLPSVFGDDERKAQERIFSFLGKQQLISRKWDNGISKNIKINKRSKAIAVSNFSEANIFLSA